MARVTVEDCISQVPNRFELVILAAERAKNISSGAPLTIARGNDKNPVIALREIAAGNIDIAKLRDMIVANLQKTNKIDEEASDENLFLNNQDVLSLGSSYAQMPTNDDFSDQDDFLDIDFADNITEDD